MTNYYIQDEYIGKEVKIDWFQVTFDFIPVKFMEDTNRYVLDREDSRFIELMTILNPMTDNIKTNYGIYINDYINNLESRKSGRYRFANGYLLGDNIELMYGGNKTNLETFPTTLIFTGQGCREFELAGGDWIKLFEFIFKHSATGYLKLGRLDIAIDDFSGDEITPYQLEKYLRKHHYISIFRKIKYDIEESHSSNPETTSYAFTFGSKGSNMLQIYDKKLERRAKQEIDKDTKVWFRYEMRFVEDKAKEVLDLYIESVKSQNITFLSYMQGVLKGLLDIKVENPSDSRIQRWETLPEWDLFLGSLDKIDLRKRSPITTSIESKIKWFESDMSSTLLELALLFKGDVEKINTYINDLMATADFKERHLKRINVYKDKLEEEKFTMKDVKAIQDELSSETLEDKLIKILLYSNDRIDNYHYDEESKKIFIYDRTFDFMLSDHDSFVVENLSLFVFNKNDLSTFITIKLFIEDYAFKSNNFKKNDKGSI